MLFRSPMGVGASVHDVWYNTVAIKRITGEGGRAMGRACDRFRERGLCYDISACPPGLPSDGALISGRRR